MVGLVGGGQAQLGAWTGDDVVLQQTRNVDDGREDEDGQQGTTSSTQTDVASGVQWTTYHHVATDRHDHGQPSAGQREHVHRRLLVGAVVHGQQPVQTANVHLQQSNLVCLLGGAVVRTSDFLSSGRGFDSLPRRNQVT